MRYTLPEKIIEMSVSKNWDDAKKEWSVIRIFVYPDYCLCGHEIKENIVIQNKNNQNETTAGNCCINKFFENKDYNKAFKALYNKKINRLLLDLSFNQNIINNKEYKFACDVWRKRNLTFKQHNWLEQIKEKIFRRLVL